MHTTLNLLRLTAAATLGLLVTVPGWAAAPPAPFKAVDVGDTGAAGAVDVDADGVWTVQGSGELENSGDQDSFFFVYQELQGDGTIIARLVEQVRESGTQPKTGIMIRASVDPGAPHAGLIMTTSTLSWHHRDEPDTNNVRRNGAGPREFPTWMRIQRTGDIISGFVSTDGKLWTPAAVPSPPPIPLGPTALFGLAVSARTYGELTTGIFDNVRVLPGVISVTGIEGAATDTMALLAWQPIATAAGYNVYRGDAEDSLKLITPEPRTDPFFFDQENIGKSLRTQVYAVAGVFKAADGTVSEGPLVRAR